MPEPNALHIEARTPDEKPAARLAELAVAGLAGNARTAVDYSTARLGVVDLTECFNTLLDAADRVQRGDLRDAEALLMAQAVSLNAIFTELAGRAMLNMGQLNFADRYLRLAFKAQGQCRATLETLATIKNPPTVFARQANIAHGPQQVNNALTPPNLEAHARAGISESEPNKLLEAHAERLDTRAPGAASAGDPNLASVGAVHRPTNG